MYFIVFGANSLSIINHVLGLFFFFSPTHFEQNALYIFAVL